MKHLPIFTLFALLTIWAGLAFGGGYNQNNTTVSNYYESTTITSGVSDKDLAQALALSFSMSHPFDFATYEWQASITGAYYDEENAISFGVGKRFKKIDALWHIEAGQNGSSEAFVGGVVFRF